jgi:hypothetical protein
MGVEEAEPSRDHPLIATKIATQISRRKKLGRKGQRRRSALDDAQNMKYGGEIIDLGTANDASRNPGRPVYEGWRLHGLLQLP